MLSSMKIEVLLTPFAWLQIDSLTRNRLSKEFGMKRSAPPRCVTQNGRTVVESDGHSVEDLKAMNAESMQKWMGFTTIDPDADIHALLGLCAKKIMDETAAIEAERLRAEIALLVPPPEVKPVEETEEAPKAKRIKKPIHNITV